MISASDLRKGIVIELEGKLYQVIDYQHIKMKHNALARIRLRTLSGGHTIEHTFPSDEKLVDVELERRHLQYLYHDEDLYYFMDEANFEQVTLGPDQLGDGLNYLKDNLSVQATAHRGEIIGIELPVTVELEVTRTEPGYKGDTATAGTKPAVMETGLSLLVPLFINEGDIIKVDTRSGEYLERISG